MLTREPGMTFLHVYPGTSDPVQLAPGASATWACPECRRPLPVEKAIDVQVDVTRMSGSPLSWLAQYPLALGRRDFLKALAGDRLASELFLGRVIDAKGRVFEDWVTYRSATYTLVRGTTHAQARRCPACSQMGYFAAGERYLHPPPPADREIFASHLVGIIVRGKTADDPALQGRRKLEIEELPVLDAPLDGLGEL